MKNKLLKPILIALVALGVHFGFTAVGGQMSVLTSESCGPCLDSKCDDDSSHDE